MKKISALVGVTMLLIAGIVVYQVKGNFLPFHSFKGDIVGGENCIAGYLSDSACDVVSCTQKYNTGKTDPTTKLCIIETKVCKDTSLCELPPPAAGDLMASCCKNTLTNSLSCMTPVGNCPNGSVKVGDFQAASCTNDCQLVSDNLIPPSSEPALPPVQNINPVPPDTSNVEPPVITITPPTTNQGTSMSSLASSQNSNQKICSNKEKVGAITGESNWIQASLWANFESTKKNEALISAQGKCAAATSILVDGCGTCVDKGINRTLDVSSVTYSQTTKLSAGITYIKSIATGTCKAVRTCDCPLTQSQSCQKI